MTTSGSRPDAVELAKGLIDALVGQADGRLRGAQLVKAGNRVILAKAFHRPSQQDVLLTISNPDFAQGVDQAAKIARLMVSAKSAALGSVMDSAFFRFGDYRGTWIATTWHAEAETLEIALKNTRMPIGIIEALVSTAHQLQAIHDAGYAHGDISSSNVVVSKRGSVHLIDLEYVTDDKFLSGRGTFLTQVYSHPARLGAIEHDAYDIRAAQMWDRYALGQLILQILADADPYHFPELDLWTQRALRLIGCLLLSGANDSSEVALGLSVQFFQSQHYPSLHQAISALERISDSQSVSVGIPELSRVPSEVVQVGTSDPAPFTDRVRELVSTPQMRQLSSCLQLGLICLIWPTASHTRLEHALGTFAMMRDAIIALHADPQSPLFRVLMGPREIRTLLVAALLHDVGHYPLAHDLEEAYPQPFRHETRSISYITSEPIAGILSRAEGPSGIGWEVNPADVASVIAGSVQAGSDLSPAICELMHSILSGSLDVDKMDYLVRDSNALGVAAGGGIDVRRVISSLTIAVVGTSDGSAKLRLAVRAKGVRPAELVGRVRSHMFGVAYWHRSYRAIKAMLHWMVWTAVLSEHDGPDEMSADEMKRSGRELAQRIIEDVAEPSSDTLPVMPGLLETMQVNGLSQIPFREAVVLASINSFERDRVSRIRDKSSDVMLRLLTNHKWYKAVLTIDHYQNLQVSSPEEAKSAKRLWETLQKFIDPRRKINHEATIHRRMRLSMTLQNRVLRELSDARPITRILNPRETYDRMLTEASTCQLFLVDFIEKSKSKDKPLYFLVAERSGSRLTNTASSIPVRESFDQKQLTEEFLVSNGAIRIFCHPDYATFVAASLSAERLERILLEAAESLL